MTGHGHVRRFKNVLAVVLAAGGGTRFAGHGHKLLAQRDGRTVVDHAVAAAHTGLGEVLVVTGATPLPASDAPWYSHRAGSPLDPPTATVASTD